MSPKLKQDKKANAEVRKAEKKTPALPKYDLDVDSDGDLLHVIEVGDQILVARLDTFKKKTALDIRRFYRGDDEKWHPTAKGVRIPEDRMREFVESLNRILMNRTETR